MAESPTSLLFAAAIRAKPAGARRKPRRTKVELQALDGLRAWRDADHLDDCPLPTLYRGMKAISPRLTIGQFHDALRSLHESRAIYLQPWTAPLYEIAEPALALLAGHEIMYYASLRE